MTTQFTPQQWSLLVNGLVDFFGVTLDNRGASYVEQIAAGTGSDPKDIMAQLAQVIPRLIMEGGIR